MVALAPDSAAPVRMMPRIGPAQGAHSRPVATPSSSEPPIRSSLPLADSRSPSPTSGRIARSARLREDQQQREGGEQDDRDPAAGAVGGNRPAAADRGQRGDAGEGDRHAGEQRQAIAQERPVGAGEDERQHRQDAGAEDGEDAAEIGEEEDQHQAGFDLAQGRLECEAEAVDAMALAGRRRAIVEHMAEVPAAAAAMLFGADHAERQVALVGDGVRQRLPEARPAGAAVDIWRPS